VILKLLILVSLSTIFCMNFSEAHPVAYAGSYSIMTWNSKEMSDWMFTHTFTPYYSLSARMTRVETSEGERRFYIPHLNFLVQRWNELDSQANIYLSMGHGGERVNKLFKDASLLAIEADWESRKYYASLKEEALLTYKKRSSDLYMTKVRVGFAPYLAEFNELNSWFILEATKINKGIDSYALTPYVRLFYKNVLTEFGHTQNGASQFNFMVHF